MAFGASEVLAHVKSKMGGGEQAALSSEEVQALGVTKVWIFRPKFVPSAGLGQVTGLAQVTYGTPVSPSGSWR